MAKHLQIHESRLGKLISTEQFDLIREHSQLSEYLERHTGRLPMVPRATQHLRVRVCRSKYEVCDKVAGMTLRRVCASHSIKVHLRSPCQQRPGRKGVATKRHAKVVERAKRKESRLGELQCLREADRMKRHFLLLHEGERDPHA